MTEFGTGGCLCRKVRYVCKNYPLMTGACHCRDCQLNTGSAFATLLIFSKETVTIDGGTIRIYQHQGDSGQLVRRSFCDNCGSPFMVEYDVTPDFRVMMGGTFDKPEVIIPEWNIYTESKQDWVEISKEIKAFDRGFKR